MNPLIMVDLTLFLLTWNVKDTGPDNGDFSDLLNYAFSPPNGTKEPDVIAIGLQEVAFKIIGPEAWVTRTKEILAERDYVMVKKNQLVGILLLVLVKRDSLLDFINIKTDYSRTGLGGLWGNKGAVSTRFDHKGVSIVITNSHLAAHDYNLETRISEYKKILGGQSFEIKDPDSRVNHIEDHDVSLWLGDLNFRLDDLTGQEILQKVVNADLSKDPAARKGLLDSLLEHDQLSNSRKLERAFQSYQEAPINFSPTYKFVVWTNEYDLARKPAWCDRILYRVKGSSAINVSPYDYRSHPQFSQSDHKPVTEFFSIATPKKLLKAKREIKSPKLRFITPNDWKIHNDATAYYTFDDEEALASSRLRYSSHDGSTGRASRRGSSSDLAHKSSEFDWIGLYPANFTDLEEPISFVWADSEPVTNVSSPARRLSRSSYPLSSSSSSASISLTSSYDPMASTSSSSSADSRTPLPDSQVFKVNFSELVLLKPGQFRLLYFNEDGQLQAMSDPFTIHP